MLEHIRRRRLMYTDAW